MNKARAYFFIETQWDNLGDALINRELIRLMSVHADVMLGVYPVPEYFKDMIGRDVLNGAALDTQSGRGAFLLKILLRRLTGERSYVFLSPGGWIGELDGRLNLRSWSHTALYHLLAILGVRICQLGVSYEDIGPKLGWQLRARSSAMYRHYVRDAQSRDAMQKRGVRIDGLCPDLAFHAFGNGDARANPDGVTFSFRAGQYDGQIADIKNFIGFFFDTCGTSRPVCFAVQVKKDETVNRELAAWARDAYGVDVCVEDVSHGIAAAENLYRRARIVVSNRLHVLLLAGSAGNAMIAAPIGPHNKKIAALFADIGLADHVFENASGAGALERAVRHVHDGNAQRALILSRFAELFAD